MNARARIARFFSGNMRATPAHFVGVVVGLLVLGMIEGALKLPRIWTNAGVSFGAHPSPVEFALPTMGVIGLCVVALACALAGVFIIIRKG